MSIVVLGSANTDFIVRVPRIPKPGETILGGRFDEAAGGKGANQAVAAARAGGRVSLVARLGSDALGDRAVAGYAREGIAVGSVVRDAEAPSGVAFVFVDDAGENAIAVASGANAKLSPADVEASRAEIAAARVLLLQLEVPLESVLAAARIGREAGALVVLNPAPAQPLPAALLSCVGLLTPNQVEAEALTGIEVTDRASAEAAALRLLERGAAQVIVTLGAQGALWRTAEACFEVPGHRVQAVDSTGAGDVFHGALAVALCEGAAWREALAFANAAAALSVGRAGAQSSAPQRPEIEAQRTRA